GSAEVFAPESADHNGNDRRVFFARGKFARMRVTGGWAGAMRSYLGNGAVARSLDQLRINQRPLRASVAAARNGVFLPRPARSIDDGYGLRSGREWLPRFDGLCRGVRG